MRQFTTPGSLLVLLVLSAACESGEAPTPVAESKPTAKATSAALVTTSSAAAPSATVGSIVPAVATAASDASAASDATKPPDTENVAVDESKIDKTIPDIPAGRSKPPTVAEWGKGTPVNSQGKGSRPDKCSLTIVREWLKINCTGDVTELSELDGFGAEGTDHFKALDPGKFGDIVVRLHENQALTARMTRSEGDAALFTHWPKGAAKPNIIALGVGQFPTYSSCGG